MQTVFREGKADAAAAVGALAALAAAVAALAAAVAAFAGCLRLGAVVPESPARFLAHRHWRMRDLTIDEGQVTISCLRSSKTEVVTAPKLTLEATGSTLLRCAWFPSGTSTGIRTPQFPAPRRHDGRQARRAARVERRRRAPRPPGGRGRAAHGPLVPRRHGARDAGRGLRPHFVHIAGAGSRSQLFGNTCQDSMSTS